MKSTSPLLVRVLTALWLGSLAACSASSGTGPEIGGPGPQEDAAVGDDASDQQDAATTSKPYPLAATGGSAEDGINRLNEYRKMAGLAPVTVNNDPAHACEAHLDYLLWEAKSNGKGTCFLSHTEDNQSNPFYSADNELAGMNSVIACGWVGNTMQGMSEAVDLWINSLYHRLPLLNNGMTEVGYASKDGLSCINHRAGTQKVKAPGALVWPPTDAIDVPTDFGGFEAPCPTKPDNPLATNGVDCAASGFIVTASWYGWGKFQNVGSVQLVDDVSSTPVELLVWFGDGVLGHDPAPGYTPDTISIVPASSLAPNTKYRVEIKGTVGGKSSSMLSTFTTGQRSK